MRVTRPCELLGRHRASLYDAPAGTTPRTLWLVRRLDEPCTPTPCSGARRLTGGLRRLGEAGNRQRVPRLMSRLGLEAIDPRPPLRQGGSTPAQSPSLRGAREGMRPPQGWATDLTSIRMRAGFWSLVALMDWGSREGLAWRVSKTRAVSFCREALEEARAHGPPELCTSEPGRQLTSQECTRRRKHAAGRLRMDRQGRGDDHRFVERLWRTVKDAAVDGKDGRAVPEGLEGLGDDCQVSHHARAPQALRSLTPAEGHCSRGRAPTFT